MKLGQAAVPVRSDPGSLADVAARCCAWRPVTVTEPAPTVLVLSDGSSVLSCGDLGAEAVRPVLERKCEVIERATGMNAFPLRSPGRAGRTRAGVELLRSNYDAILMVDIAAPRCFELQRLLAKAPWTARCSTTTSRARP